jgi:membrane-bound metal-dependent hydrolase YbcI (DUF457 family)
MMKMGYAVTHVIIAIVLIDLYRDYIAKKKFSTWFVLIGGVAGLLPDLDLPLGWLATAVVGETIFFHRIITHSLFFVGLFLLLAIPFYMHRNLEMKVFKWRVPFEFIAIFFTVIAFGWLTHIALDCMLAGDFSLTWFPGHPLGFCIALFSEDALLGIDAIILMLWLIHEEWAKKIKDFI